MESCSQSRSRVLTFLVSVSLPEQIVRKTADTFDEAHTPASACPRTPSRLNIQSSAAKVTLEEVEICWNDTFCRHCDALFLLLQLLLLSHRYVRTDVNGFLVDLGYATELP